MAKQDRLRKSAPHSGALSKFDINAQVEFFTLDVTPTFEIIRRPIFRAPGGTRTQNAPSAMVERLNHLCGRMNALVNEAELIVGRLREMARAPRSERPPTDTTTEAPLTPPPAIVHFHGPIVAYCDKEHVEDVLEDDETYVDWSKRGPKN